MAMDKDLLKKLAQLCAEEEDDKVDKPSLEQQQVLLTELFSQPHDQFKPGDFVVRNKFGEARYKFPHDGETCIIMDVYAEPLLSQEGDTVHGVIGTLVDGKKGYDPKCPPVVTHCVDFRYYKLWKGQIH